jgi:cell division septal protein FtsQ
MLRTEQIYKLTEAVAQVTATRKWPDDVTVSVDVDPQSLL